MDFNRFPLKNLFNKRSSHYFIDILEHLQQTSRVFYIHTLGLYKVHVQSAPSTSTPSISSSTSLVS